MKENKEKWYKEGGHYPPGTLSYHFPEPGAKRIYVNTTQRDYNNKKGYVIYGDNHFDPDGYSFFDWKASNAKEFGFIDYDAHINLKINYIFNNVYGELQDLENNFLHLLCIQEQTQLLTNLALSINDPLLSGFLLTGNRSTFALVEGPIIWLYTCKTELSPLFIAKDRCYDNIPIFYEDTLQFVHPLSRQTKQIARPIPCKNIPQNLIALDPSDENSDWYMLMPTPVKQQPPKLLNLITTEEN